MIKTKNSIQLLFLFTSRDANWCNIICQIKIPKWCSSLALNTNQSQEWFNCFIWNRLGKACSWLWLDPKSAFLSLKSVPRPQLGVSEKSKSKSEDICLGNNWGRINLFLQERISNNCTYLPWFLSFEMKSTRITARSIKTWFLNPLSFCRAMFSSKYRVDLRL